MSYFTGLKIEFPYKEIDAIKGSVEIFEFQSELEITKKLFSIVDENNKISDNSYEIKLNDLTTIKKILREIAINNSKLLIADLKNIDNMLDPGDNVKDMANAILNNYSYVDENTEIIVINRLIKFITSGFSDEAFDELLNGEIYKDLYSDLYKDNYNNIFDFSEMKIILYKF